MPKLTCIILSHKTLNATTDNMIMSQGIKIANDLIKRNPLDTTDRLTLLIMDAVTHVTLKDCRGWIKYAVSFFPRCIAKEEML